MHLFEILMKYNKQKKYNIELSIIIYTQRYIHLCVRYDLLIIPIIIDASTLVIISLYTRHAFDPLYQRWIKIANILRISPIYFLWLEIKYN